MSKTPRSGANHSRAKRSTVGWLIPIAGLSVAAVLSVVAGAHAINKLPEEAFVKRMGVPQFSFENFTQFNEAIAEIENQEARFLTTELTLTSERGNLTLSLEALGFMPSTADTREYLSSFMADATLLEKTQVYLFGKTLELPATVDTETLKLAFAESGIEQGVKNAELTYQNGVIIDPEQIGYGVDTDALAILLRSYWEDSFKVPAEAELPLRTSEPEIRTADLEAMLSAVQQDAERTFTLEDEYSDYWEFSIAEHVSLLVPGENETVAIDEEKFIAAVELELVPEIEQDPQSVVITENEDGTYSFEGSARFGREIDKTALREMLEDALNLTDPETDETTDTLQLPLIQTEPEVTVPDSLRERGITELVGVGYSTYKSSPSNRIHNVNRGFEQFNGVLLEQGAEFSFTSLMGEIDAANGWLPELVIKGDETIPEYGGGLCQVSSTMFRAALYSGLPITMRKNHSYAVSYYAYPYGYGLDATVYDPLPDLRFINDTPADILIQGYTDGYDAYFVFYGTNDGRTVSMDGPYSYDYHSTSEVLTEYTDELAPGERQLEEYAHTGFKVDWYRTVYYPEYTEEEIAEGIYVSPYAQTVSGVRENIHTEYEARPAKYLEGKAVDESTGAEEGG